jgi:predicted regulator of Ras-like GTPase activity (Roadblock/LC7/MglB family)
MRMTFREILANVIDGTPGALAGAIMAGDGIPIEEYAVEGVEGADAELAAVAAEFEHVLGQVRKVTGALYGETAGALDELILQTPGRQLLFRQIDDEYFLLVALEPTGMLGKARFLARASLDDLREEL